MTTPIFEIKWIFLASSRFVCSDSTIVCCWYVGLAKIAGSGLDGRGQLWSGQIVVRPLWSVCGPLLKIVELAYFVVSTYIAILRQ